MPKISEPTMPTVMNAITYALACAGAEPVDMPVTPEKVWRALKVASAA